MYHFYSFRHPPHSIYTHVESTEVQGGIFFPKWKRELNVFVSFAHTTINTYMYTVHCTDCLNIYLIVCILREREREREGARERERERERQASPT